SGERLLVRRFQIFALALITPELIVLWALRQWVLSRKLARKYQDFGWTQTHGFFVIMGGFQACHSNGTTPPFTLVPDDISACLENHDITISEQDIQDKSKGDLLGKSLVLLQVTWFILQTIARAVRHLGITEIELATLAFAILNFFTYFCWRNKPLDVSLPLQVTADYLYTHHHSDNDSTDIAISSTPKPAPVPKTTPV
ncbi:hypothetical protein DXG01_014245, partial [Tephrocybe rancida]